MEAAEGTGENGTECTEGFSRVTDHRSPSPTDFFEDSLYSLFSHNQPAHGDPGDIRTYSHPGLPAQNGTDKADCARKSLRYGITKNNAANNKLFAHFQWDAGLYLADIIVEGSCGTQERQTVQMGDIDGMKGSLVDVRGKNVVELGAGTGLPGLVACVMGAHHTVLTDYPDTLILDNLRRNLDLALLQPSSDTAQANTSLHPGSLHSRIQVQGLAWGESDQEAAVLATSEREEGFDIVLAADVLWISSAHPSLIHSIRTLLKRHRASRCLLVAGYHTGRPAVRRFFVQLGQPIPSEDGVIVPDWEGKHGGIFERHIDGTERPMSSGWIIPQQASTPEQDAGLDLNTKSRDEDMGDISDRSSWMIVSLLRWKDLA